MAFYPTSIEVAPGISVCTGFTGPIVITPDYLQMPLDGTIFKTEDGYKRTAEAADLPISPSVPADLDIIIGDYVVQSFANTLNAKDYEYQTKLLKFIPIDVLLKHATSLKFDEGNFVLTAQPHITIGKFFNFEAQVTLKVNPIIKPGKAGTIATVDPGLNDIRLSKARVSIFGLNIGVTHIINLTTWLMVKIAHKIIPEVEIPALSMMGFFVKESEFDSESGYAEASMSVKFT
jgi:hypothetical protein